ERKVVLDVVDDLSLGIPRSVVPAAGVGRDAVSGGTETFAQRSAGPAGEQIPGGDVHRAERPSKSTAPRYEEEALLQLAVVGPHAAHRAADERRTDQLVYRRRDPPPGAVPGIGIPQALRTIVGAQPHQHVLAVPDDASRESGRL